MSKMIRKNISVREAACPHCGKLPSDRLLDRLQALREACSFPLPFRSINRCPIHNKLVGGHINSVHQLGAQDNDYGAGDIGLHKRYSKKRYILLNRALRLGFNNIEVCNGHIHAGIAPKGHPMYDSLYWGISQ